MKLTQTESDRLETAREDLWTKIGPKQKNEIRVLRGPHHEPARRTAATRAGRAK